MPDNTIEQEIARARDRLLDLSLRNRLLKYKPAHQRSLKIVDEIPREVYDTLVLNEKDMRFRGAFGRARTIEEHEEIEPEEVAIWRPLDEKEKVHPRHTDRLLQTELESEVLQKRLFRISAQARGFFEEQGYSILYLAVGFLYWTEAGYSELSHPAPLILMPVELARAGVGAAYRLSWSGDDLYTNVSLQAKLREQDIALPDFEMPENKEGVDVYFKEVSESVHSKKDWKVTTETYLDFFSFTKFVMWKDLAPTAWINTATPKNHPVLQEMYGFSVPGEAGNEFREEDIDEKLTSTTSHHVLDADPPQICVMETIKLGRNLVVEGPPGTGKSQTIVNTIAELLAAEKKVLFVSEKMAALNVVKRRLDEVGIGNWCLELHSHKSNRKAFYESIRQMLNRRDIREGGDVAEAYEWHDELKKELNNYASLLRSPVGRINWSLYRLFGIRTRAQRYFENRSLELPKLDIKNPKQITLADWEVARAKLKDIVRLSSTVWPIVTNPWKGTSPSLLLPGDENAIASVLQRCSTRWYELSVALIALSDQCALRSVQCLSQVKRAVEAARGVAVSRPNNPSVLLNPEWNTPSQSAQELIVCIEQYQEQRRLLIGVFSERAFETANRQQLEELENYARKVTRLFIGAFWRSRASIRCFYRAKAPINVKKLLLDFRSLINCIELRQRLCQAEEAGKNLFGSHWRSEESEPLTLRQFAEWVIQFRQDLLSNVLTKRACDLIYNGINREEIESNCNKVTKLAADFGEALQQLDDQLRINWAIVLNDSLEDVDLSVLHEHLEEWRENIIGLVDWSRYVQRRDEKSDDLSNAVITLLESGSIKDATDAISALEVGFADALLHDAIRGNRALEMFAGSEHEGIIHEFMDYDRNIIKWNRERLARKLLYVRPQMPERISRNDPMWALRHQLGLQRPSLPIRKMINLAGEIIQQIKPCFMMSPLSVAQFIEPGRIHFDVVLFDEASQIRTEDALGAVLRGDQMVVMGDTQQLPPTSFFDKMAGGEEADGENEDPLATEQNESILQRCKTGFASRTLEWHYRSRHESLIAVSNREFYGNRLNVFPSAHAQVEHLGVHLVHVPESVYDRGRSRTNRIEAERVADAVVEHAHQWPEKSLGVGTFSVAQQDAIEKAIEARRRQHPELEEFFGERGPDKFFVKNLESIQGDERDVIFVSVGYGRDETGRMNRHFGPLNNVGGEKRLNVLLTRARERCVIFSNFLADDLEVSSNTPEGVRVLKEYLAFAKDRKWPIVENTREDADSLFEEAVGQFLDSKGYDIRRQVGCAKYFIDLAVVHPKHQGRYVIGVECDGAMYHSSRVARERDRLRQEVLERLGWRLCRVWSTDWFLRREVAQKRLLQAVEAAMLVRDVHM